MIRYFQRLWVAPQNPAAPVDHAAQRAAGLLLMNRMQGLDADPYMLFADRRLKLVSVFDDLKYDRSDADMLSPAMRTHAIRKLQVLGFRQISGTVLEHAESDMRVLVPKFHALGASPFHITRHTPKRAQDFWLLTPTQVACQFVDNYPLETAVERIKTLIARQPINIYRMFDFLERSPRHEAFKPAIGHLKYVQRRAVESEPLRRRRALG